ncbi:MAG: metallophosphoesterase [Nanoarchaeota archaeon]
MNITVFGDIHSHWQQMYDAVAEHIEVRQEPVDLVLSTGDVESLPDRARYPTIFIGGNHDRFPQRHPCEIIPDLFYLGRSGVIQYENITIGGMSGEYDSSLFFSPPPSDPADSSWGCYRLEDLPGIMRTDIDILLLHDRSLFPRPQKSAQVMHAQLLAFLQPEYVFAGHHHAIYAEHRLGRTYIFGLEGFDGNTTEQNAKVVRLP